MLANIVPLQTDFLSIRNWNSIVYQRSIPLWDKLEGLRVVFSQAAVCFHENKINQLHNNDEISLDNHIVTNFGMFK